MCANLWRTSWPRPGRWRSPVRPSSPLELPPDPCVAACRSAPHRTDRAQSVVQRDRAWRGPAHRGQGGRLPMPAAIAISVRDHGSGLDDEGPRPASSTASGAPIPPAPAPSGGPGSGCPSRWRTPGCTAAAWRCGAGPGRGPAVPADRAAGRRTADGRRNRHCRWIPRRCSMSRSRAGPGAARGCWSRLCPGAHSRSGRGGRPAGHRTSRPRVSCGRWRSPPRPGMSPTEIVQGFLDAAVGVRGRARRGQDVPHAGRRAAVGS
jgi:hypothetical protein